MILQKLTLDLPDTSIHQFDSIAITSTISIVVQVLTEIIAVCGLYVPQAGLQ